MSWRYEAQTLTRDFSTSVKNILADNSFANGIPNPKLAEYVNDAKDYLIQLTNDPSFLGYNVTLTGHSLGGAIASLIGEAANIETVTFDAPGAAKLVTALSSTLQNIPNGIPSPGNAVTNYRFMAMLSLS